MAVLASALVAFGAGCAASASTEPPPNVDAQPVEVAPADDVVYVDAPPVDDVESYPYVVYGGVNVYYVDGRWYQRGPRGWAYYRQEPADLGRQREEHAARDHDPRWGGQRGEQPRGMTNAQPPERRDQPTRQMQPGRGQQPTAPGPTAQPRKRVETVTPPAPRRAPSKRRTTPAPARNR